MKRTIRVLLATLITVFALAAPSYAQSSLTTTACPGVGCVTLPVGGQGGIGIQVTGTFSGTLTFQASVDGATYASMPVLSIAGGSAVTTTTTTGLWTASIAGLTQVRVVFTSWASGTAVVSATMSTARTTQSFAVIGAAAFTQAQPADQVARSSSGGTFVMVGLGAAAAPCTITPGTSGRVVFTISGDIVNNTTATTVSVKMAEGTGAAPANNASAVGTVISRTVLSTEVTSVLTVPFSITATKTALALGTAVWFDLQITTSSTNTGQPTNVDCTAVEI